MEFQDYYKVLGVARDASADDVRRAYRKLALKWHPDRHPVERRAEAEARFKQIAEAYEVLSNPDSRKRYDALGARWKQGQEFTPPPGGGGGARQMTPEEFERAFGGSGFSEFFTRTFGDQFRDLFGGGGPAGARHARYRHRGADVRAELTLTVGEALAGGQRRFDLPALVSCPRCGGVGSLGRHVCPTCVGVGSVRQRRTVEVTLPRAVRDGLTLRLKGLGEPGEAGGESGDLHLTLHLENDDTWRLRGADLEATLPVAPWEATFGTRLGVRTPDGPVTLSVPAGSRAGARLRLRGKGLPAADGTRGDLIVVLQLALPTGLNDTQRGLLEELSRAGPSKVRGGVREEDGA